MARKLGQIIARGQSTWLVRIYQGRDHETGTRKYLNQTIHGPFREVQRFLNLKLQQRDLSRTPRGGHYPQPVPRPVAGDVGQAEAPSQNFPRLRVASPALYPAFSGHAPDRHDRADGDARALRADVRPWIVSEDDRVHERGG
jgi:hypothetical protein